MPDLKPWEQQFTPAPKPWELFKPQGVDIANPAEMAKSGPGAPGQTKTPLPPAMQGQNKPVMVQGAFGAVPVNMAPKSTADAVAQLKNITGNYAKGEGALYAPPLAGELAPEGLSKIPGVSKFANDVLVGAENTPFVGRFVKAIEGAPTMLGAAGRGAASGAIAGGTEGAFHGKPGQGAAYGAGGGALLGAGLNVLGRIAAPSIPPIAAEPTEEELAMQAAKRSLLRKEAMKTLTGEPAVPIAEGPTGPQHAAVRAGQSHALGKFYRAEVPTTESPVPRPKPTVTEGPGVTGGEFSEGRPATIKTGAVKKLATSPSASAQRMGVTQLNQRGIRVPYISTGVPLEHTGSPSGIVLPEEYGGPKAGSTVTHFVSETPHAAKRPPMYIYRGGNPEEVTTPATPYDTATTSEDEARSYASKKGGSLLRADLNKIPSRKYRMSGGVGMPNLVSFTEPFDDWEKIK